MAPLKHSRLTTINLMNHSPRKTWSHGASHRAFNLLLTAVIALSLNSQAFAQKTSTTTKKAQATATKKQKRRASIDQQILAQAQALQTPGAVKIYSDDVYKRKAQKQKSTRKTIAQSNSTNFGPSDTVDLEESRPASSANISLQMDQAKKDAQPANKLSGSVAVTVGNDSNLDLDREGKNGGFFEMKPGLSYEGSTFSGSFGARVKDYSNQENSAIAKETDITADIAAKFSLSENITTKSKIGFLNSEFRWPDYLGGTDEGMPIRFFETKLTQSLDMKFDKLTIGINGSYSNRDFTTDYQDFAPDVLGSQGFQRDLNDAKLDAKVDLKFNDNLSFVARPLIKHRKYKDEPARQTNGAKGGAALAASTPRRETLTNELGVDLNVTLGAFTITPTATVGQDVDRALGAEDTSYTSAGLSLEVMIDKDLGLKIGASMNQQFTKFDNWIEKVPTGELREDEDLNTGLSAAVNLTKSVALGIDYAREEAKSNTTYTDENYNREIIGSTITVSF